LVKRKPVRATSSVRDKGPSLALPDREGMQRTEPQVQSSNTDDGFIEKIN
jgi:hypothetical protein